jgi:hypothetical protein
VALWSQEHRAVSQSFDGGHQDECRERVILRRDLIGVGLQIRLHQRDVLIPHRFELGDVAHARQLLCEHAVQLGIMRRGAIRNARSIVIETFGSGSSEPAPPSPELAELYAWLEREHGFARRAIRTDYAVPSVARAAEVTGFFFGAEFARRVEAERWTRIPECTGIEWQTL